MTFEFLSANAFDLDWSKILSFGKELKVLEVVSKMILLLYPQCFLNSFWLKYDQILTKVSNVAELLEYENIENITPNLLC